MSAAILTGLAVAAALALAGGLWLLQTRRQLRQASELWSQRQVAMETRIKLLEQRLLDLGDHVIAVERRVNVTLEQGLLQRAGIDAGQGHESEQARRLRSASSARDTAPEADAEARLRALLAQQNKDRNL